MLKVGDGSTAGREAPRARCPDDNLTDLSTARAEGAVRLVIDLAVR